MKQVTITYALRVKSTGALVRYVVHDNTGGYACVSESHILRADGFSEGLPVYEQASLQKLAVALSENTPNYNATYDHPNHGELNVEELEMVKRTVTEELEVQQFSLPLELTRVLHMVKPLSILRRYAGVPDLPETARAMELFELPDGETIETIRRRAQQEVFKISSYQYGRFLAVFNVPEDYLIDLKGKPGFGAIVVDAH